MVCLAAGPVFVDGGGLRAYSSTQRTHIGVRVQVSYFGKREGGGRRKKGDTGGNNAGLEKLKKRARRAAITSDVSRPNDRHLSARSRCYAKSPHCHSVPPCCQ